MVTLLDMRGTGLPPPADEERDPGAERGTARMRFRNPYRSSGKPSTQLPAGESATLIVPLRPGAVRARIELVYKLSPWVPDSESDWTYEIDISLRR